MLNNRVWITNAVKTAGRAEGSASSIHNLATGEIDAKSLASVPWIGGDIPQPIDLNFLAQMGAKLVASDPVLLAAAGTISATCQPGYYIGCACMRYRMTETQFVTIRESMPSACLQRGFDLAVSLHIGRVVNAHEAA